MSQAPKQQSSFSSLWNSCQEPTVAKSVMSLDTINNPSQQQGIVTQRTLLSPSNGRHEGGNESTHSTWWWLNRATVYCPYARATEAGAEVHKNLRVWEQRYSVKTLLMNTKGALTRYWDIHGHTWTTSSYLRMNLKTMKHLIMDAIAFTISTMVRH